MSRTDFKQIVTRHLVYNYEMAVFKLKGYTLAIVLRPKLTKLIKRIE